MWHHRSLKWTYIWNKHEMTKNLRAKSKAEANTVYAIVWVLRRNKKFYIIFVFNFHTISKIVYSLIVIPLIINCQIGSLCWWITSIYIAESNRPNKLNKTKIPTIKTEFIAGHLKCIIGLCWDTSEHVRMCFCVWVSEWVFVVVGHILMKSTERSSIVHSIVYSSATWPNSVKEQLTTCIQRVKDRTVFTYLDHIFMAKAFNVIKQWIFGFSSLWLKSLWLATKSSKKKKVN